MANVTFSSSIFVIPFLWRNTLRIASAQVSRKESPTCSTSMRSWSTVLEDRFFRLGNLMELLDLVHILRLIIVNDLIKISSDEITHKLKHLKPTDYAHHIQVPQVKVWNIVKLYWNGAEISTYSFHESLMKVSSPFPAWLRGPRKVLDALKHPGACWSRPKRSRSTWGGCFATSALSIFVFL